MTVPLLAAAFVLVIGGAILFTNSVEWAGRKLGLGHSAVGSVLAAVSTALPESAIPAVALVRGGGGGPEVEIAIGSIVGAPFLLGTLAMAMVGLSALAFRRRRERGARIHAGVTTGRRDLLVFAAVLAAGLAAGAIGLPRAARLALAATLVLGYLSYVWWTVRRSGGAEQEEPEALYLDWTKQDPPSTVQVVVQLVLALAAIIGGAELFVTEVEHLARSLGVGLLVLSLVLAPLATELPEKANSVLWVREGKDTLALGNITGAMVFQSSLPIALGLAFTPWSLSAPALVAGAAGIGGGLLAAWRLDGGDFGPAWITVWLAGYLGAVAYAALA